MARRPASRRCKPLPVGEFDAQIVDLAEDGRGVARVDGKVTFIHGALPGETVRFAYTRVHRDADEGELRSIAQSSPDRVAPPCPHFGVCGGCSLQHLAPAAQIAHKQQRLLDTLQRIGKVRPDAVAAALTGPTLGYRRRARLGVRYVDKRGSVLVGFRERASPLLAALDSCLILDPRIGLRLRELGAAIATLSIRRQVPQIEIACAEPAVLVLRVMAPPSDADLRVLQTLAADHDFVLYLQTGGPDTAFALQDPAPPLETSPDGSDDRLRFAPTDFVQINAAVSQQAVRQALDWLAPAPGSRVLELFCGLGNFSVPLARRGARVTGVEGDRALVRRARENARRLGLETAIDFHVADLFLPNTDATWLHAGFDSVLLDPPRAGAETMMALIGRQQPPRVLYVSCHPATLARDAGILVHHHGYRLQRVGVMDMFAHTSHVESMALFARDAEPGGFAGATGSSSLRA